MLFGIPIAIGIGLLTSASLAAAKRVELIQGKTYAFRARIVPAMDPVLSEAMQTGLKAGGARFITVVNAPKETIVAYQQPTLATHSLELNRPITISMGGLVNVELTYLSIEEVT